MMPSVMRSLAATDPPRPSAEAGTIVGKANPAATAWVVRRRNDRRDGCEDVLLGRFIGVFSMFGSIVPCLVETGPVSPGATAGSVSLLGDRLGHVDPQPAEGPEEVAGCEKDE